MPINLTNVARDRLEVLCDCINAKASDDSIQLAYNDLLSVLQVLNTNHIQTNCPSGWSE